MLSCCRCRLLQVLGPSSPLLTCQLLCVPRLLKLLVVFVLGGPFAGKGTQCARIVEKYGHTHLSAGELLRDERKNPESQYGELIEKYIKEGKIVPVEITISLLKKEMDQTMTANAQKNKFLIDGFPRNQDNLKGWNKTMDGKADVSFVFFFDLHEEMGKVKKIDASKSVDEVFDEVVKIFDKEG
ncbi:UMP-CMP kinase [Heterocephalus glaber]|uniref:UMP-CMP kinase n=1 Tax=Heterocephalus glaber TaxID=10181 RepID=G5CAL6_HETGA|nr:UMP-CMP kinase [Heterocephalus glaber]